MPMQKEEPQFLVNPYGDPVMIQVHGKASFLNSAPVKELFDRLVMQGKKRFVLDFQNCTGMDSTFLGILAGLGITMMNEQPAGSVVLCRLGERNLELIENLGLNRLLVVDKAEKLPGHPGTGDLKALDKGHKLSEIENARLVLKAHESLVEADPSNKAKFQDVITFLKSQMEGQ